VCLLYNFFPKRLVLLRFFAIAPLYILNCMEFCGALFSACYWAVFASIRTYPLYRFVHCLAVRRQIGGSACWQGAVVIDSL
jgi:hypothetical protein